jgi:membrane protease YdiL (CAAX protease family)
MFLYIYDVHMLPPIVLGMLAGTVFLTWLYNGSGGSVLAVIVWHGLYNTITASQAGEGIIGAVMTTLVIVWPVLVAVWQRHA